MTVSSAVAEIPIFELPLAVLPTERVPLHIFEERYKRMIGHCLGGDEPFGIVLRTDEGVRGTGCAARVSDVLERFDDGRLNIVVTGDWRFRVLDRWEGAEFPLGRVERLAEEVDPGADPSEARAAFRRLLEALESDADPEAGATTAFDIAGRLEMPVAAKQDLLEADSESSRLSLLEATLDRLTGQVERRREVAALAGKNGHRRFEGPGPTAG